MVVSVFMRSWCGMLKSSGELFFELKREHVTVGQTSISPNLKITLSRSFWLFRRHCCCLFPFFLKEFVLCGLSIGLGR